MTPKNTVAELRALLDKAGDNWTAEDDGTIFGGLADPDMPKRGREIIGRAHHYGPLIAALRNAAPDLLRVVEAAQKWATTSYAKKDEADDELLAAVRAFEAAP